MIEVFLKEPIAFFALIIAAISLGWQFFSFRKTSSFNKRVHKTESLIATQSVTNDLYESQIKPLIRGTIKSTPKSAEVTAENCSKAKRVYSYMFHLHSIMQNIESIDKQKAERLRHFIANSILWSCHFLEVIYDKSQNEEFQNNGLINMYSSGRNKEICEYFSKDLPKTVNVSWNYDIDLFD